jgi:threonine synthase
MSNSIQPSALFKCINDKCKETYPLDTVIYKCKKCDSLLEVSHDLDELKKISSKEWKKIFLERSLSYKHPNTSGVWKRREWVLPGIPEKDIISSGEGNTHLYNAQRWANDLGLESLYIKQCGVSHTGSFKDLGMTVLISQVNRMRNEGKKIRAVACASTGDTSAALASYAAKANIPTFVFLPANKVSTAQLIQPVSNGAKVLSIDTDFDGCMKIVQEVSKDESIYLANSMNSLRIEGQKTIAFEILEQLEYVIPEWIIIPGGNLGNVSALGQGLELMQELELIDKLPRIVLAQAENANPLYDSYLNKFETFTPKQARKTLASAIQIGNPVSVQKAIKILKKFNGIVEQANEEELSDAAARGDLYGLYNDPHTGVALAAMLKLIDKNIIQKKEKVVVISTANGLKFTEFKTNFHESKIEGVNQSLINKIFSLENNLENIFNQIHRLIK